MKVHQQLLILLVLLLSWHSYRQLALALVMDDSSGASSVAPTNNRSKAFLLGESSSGREDNFTCVSACHCVRTDVTRSLYAVECNGPSVRDIPSFLAEDLHQIESMLLVRTSIAQIASLRMFNRLLHLNLNQSLVQSLDSRLVTTFPALESLHLAGSRLSHVTEFRLMQHLSLRELDFSANQLENFDGSGSMSLRSLNLARNLFQRLDDVGANCVALQRLDVSGNRLTLQGLSSWEPPGELESLDLSGNQLSTSPTDTDTINNASFLLRLPRLQQLDLRRNRLVSLAPITDCLPADSKLWKLSLEGNPFICDCQLYRAKQSLALRGVIVADAPVCRLPANGSEWQLTRLGSWVCDIDSGGGGGGGEGGTSAGPPPGELGAASFFLQLPLAAVVAMAAVGLAACLCLALGLGVWLCRQRRRSRRRKRQREQSLDGDQYPYSNVAMRPVNLHGSQASVATYRSTGPAMTAMPYGFDPQRSRIFSKKLHPPSVTGGPSPAGSQQNLRRPPQLPSQLSCQRAHSEELLSRGSTPLPPIPDVAANAATANNTMPSPSPPRPQDYVDMDQQQQQQDGYQPMYSEAVAGGGGIGTGGYMYDEVQLQAPQHQHQTQQPYEASRRRQLPPVPGTLDGYLDMQDS